MIFLALYQQQGSSILKYWEIYSKKIHTVQTCSEETCESTACEKCVWHHFDNYKFKYHVSESEGMTMKYKMLTMHRIYIHISHKWLIMIHNTYCRTKCWLICSLHMNLYWLQYVFIPIRWTYSSWMANICSANKPILSIRW